MAGQDIAAAGKPSKERNRIPSMAGMQLEGATRSKKAQDMLFEYDQMKVENAKLKSDLETAKATQTVAPGPSLAQIEQERVQREEAKEQEAAKKEADTALEEDRKAEDQRRRRVASAGVLTSPSGVLEPAKLAKAGILGY